MSRARDRLVARLAARASQARPEAPPGPCPDPNLLACYQDHRLDDEEREKFERHAALCPGCRVELASLARLAFRVDFPHTNPRAVKMPVQLSPALVGGLATVVLVAVALLVGPRLGLDPLALLSRGASAPEEATTPPTERVARAQPSPTSTPEPRATPKPTSASRPEAAATPTSTPKPRATPKPTPTPRITATPRPTATPRLTPTPRPTATPRIPPTPKPRGTPRPTPPRLAQAPARTVAAPPPPAPTPTPTPLSAVEAPVPTTASPKVSRPSGAKRGVSFASHHLMTAGVTAAERYANLGVQYYLQGEQEKALTYLKSAVHRDASLPAAHFNLALLYEEHGLRREAARQWSRFIVLDPDGPKTTFARQRLQLNR